MPTIRRQVEHHRVSAGRIARTPTKPASVVKPSLWVVDPRKSAIENIVDTARPGEVLHVNDKDYYNNCLWRSYKDFNTP